MCIRIDANGTGVNIEKQTLPGPREGKMRVDVTEMSLNEGKNTSFSDRHVDRRRRDVYVRVRGTSGGEACGVLRDKRIPMRLKGVHFIKV